LDSHFVLFGPAHLGAIATVILLAAGLGPLVRRQPSLDLPVRVVLSVLAWGAEIVRQVDRFVAGDWLITHDLPIHLCALCALLVPPLLWTRSARLHGVLYCWAFAAPLQALLTPDIPDGFPSIRWFRFMVTHGIPLVATLYVSAVDGIRPGWKTIGHAVLATVAYALLLGPVDALLGANYMFLVHKPDTASVFDVLGPWPVYLFGALGFGVVVMALAIAPWEFARRFWPSSKTVVGP
jgi:hypothetical integral membrane protein (TIGR02206 family)